MRRGREQLRVLGRTADFGAVPVSANAGMGRWLFPRFPKQVTERIEVMTTDLYAANASWAQLPEGWSFTEVVGVATDSRDRVFVFSRSEHPVTIFGRDGQFVDSWGEGEFVRPHGLHIGPDDSVYCCDDQDHTVRKYTADGKLLMKLGVSGQASDTGATTTDYRDIKRVGPPFNQPTNLALSPDGEMYITDGYGNARVHKFSADGQLLYSWGEPGDGPGQFHLPHGIAVDPKGTVYVADRENSRIQLFSPEGEYITEWKDMLRPGNICVGSDDQFYVAEMGWRAGLYPGMKPPTPDPIGGRLSIFNGKGELLERWGGGDNPCSEGDFLAPHDVSADSHGDLYVGEVVFAAGVRHGLVPPDCKCLQKFVRKG